MGKTALFGFFPRPHPRKRAPGGHATRRDTDFTAPAHGAHLHAGMDQQAKGQKKSSGGRATTEPVVAASDEEINLQREYDMLTDTLNDLKRKAEQLRRENEFLQEEANQTRTESQEYMDYMAKKIEKRQSATARLSQQNQEELQRLSEEGEAMLEKYTEQANEIKREILEKEKELAMLNADIAELTEFKNLQQEQLGRVAKLQDEATAMHCSHSQCLQALKASYLSEKEKYEAQAKQKLHALTLAVSREATGCLMSHAQQVTQENQQLRQELRRLIRRAQALRSQHDRLQEQRRQLLLDKEYADKLYMRRTDPLSQAQPAGVPHS
ncbi:coiled-coil domain-containing protein 166 [Arapaima gigas]